MAACQGSLAGQSLPRAAGQPRRPPAGHRVPGSGRASGTCTTTSSSPCSTTSSASRPGAGAPAPARTATGCWGIDQAQSQAILAQVRLGYFGIKPGWTRINFNYFISDTVADYLIAAVDLIAPYGHRLLPDYRFDPASGLWRHRSGLPLPPLRLTDLRWRQDGSLASPPRLARIGEDVLAGYLDEAYRLLTVRPDRIEQGRTGLPDALDRLREFHLPPVCLPPD